MMLDANGCLYIVLAILIATTAIALMVGVAFWWGAVVTFGLAAIVLFLFVLSAIAEGFGK